MNPRLLAALAAAMLAIGVVVGAAIGPAPTASFAVGRLATLLPVLRDALSRPSATGAQQQASASAATSEVETSGGASKRRRKRHRHSSEAEAAITPSTSETSGTETTKPAATAPASGETKKSAAALPPVTKVWLIELAGSSFAEAAAQPAAGAYIDSQAVPSGTLLGGWSAIDASAFAGDAALIASSPPQLLDTIVQPACQEGAAGAACAPNTPGAVAAAGEFLKASLPTITSTAAYRENGLVVVTFASVVNATATGLPAGAATATLTSQPPVGVLLISPFATAGAKSSAAFDPTAPTHSLQKLLRR